MQQYIYIQSGRNTHAHTYRHIQRQAYIHTETDIDIQRDIVIH